MIDTKELGVGSYPVPHEIIDCEDEEEYDDYDLHYADEYHELEVLEMI